MQFDNAGAASALVQSIHVLRDQPMHVPRLFQPRQRMMRGIRPAPRAMTGQPIMLRAR